jgi:two-component system sensor histidine kinase AgrC
MEEKNIKSFLYIEKNVKNSLKDFPLEFYKDITKIFGVFIDNAIEAAEESEKKEVEIDIRKDKDSLIIDIANTFNDKANVNKIGSKGYSTKGKGHGFGLSIVKDIKIKNDNIDTFSDIENDMFKQTLIIYLK